MTNHRQQLVEAQSQLRAGLLRPFVGSELSARAGLPGRYEMASELAQKIDLSIPPREWATSQGVLDVTQAYVNRSGLNQFVTFLKQRLDVSTYSPTQMHVALTRLPVSLVFTTNLDGLLESAFAAAGKRVNLVVQDDDIPFIRHEPDTVNIVKLCGDLSQPRSIVNTQQHFATYAQKRPQITNLLTTEAGRSTLLYLGWDPLDPSFEQILAPIRSQFGDLAPMDYALQLTELSASQFQDLERRQIDVLSFFDMDEPETELVNWLLDLSPPAKGSGQGEEQSSQAAVYGTGNRWAVLVGANFYEDRLHYGSLQVCVDDVNSIRERLMQNGFQSERIQQLSDATDLLPTRENILAALQSVADATDPDDLLLFYYSGHGDESSDESYLVSRNSRRSVLQDTGVPVRRILEIMEIASARAKVLMLDACHSGAKIPGKGPQPMSEAFMRRVFGEAEGMAILASCQQGQLSYEWPDRSCSVFTHYLLEALDGHADRDDKGFVTVQDANRHVVDGVKLWASQHGASQTPTLEYTVSGDIVLVQYQ